MAQTHSKLSNIEPVYYSNKSEKFSGSIPTAQFFNNVPLLWEFLELTVNDWKREASPYQEKINNSKNQKEAFYFVALAFKDLQPYALKCMFSYAMFFVSLQNVYDKFYKQLDNLNRKPILRVSHDKKPVRTAYVNKVRKIRNISITHLPSSKVGDLEAKAAMEWQPMVLSGHAGDITNIDHLAYGALNHLRKDISGKIIEKSSDFEIKGVIEMHKFCSEYLSRYDKVCTSYLNGIKGKLPVKDSEDTLYSNSR